MLNKLPCSVDELTESRLLFLAESFPDSLSSRLHICCSLHLQGDSVTLPALQAKNAPVPHSPMASPALPRGNRRPHESKRGAAKG